MMRRDERRGAAAAATCRDQFPVGMRVLAVDDDPVCLKVLETLLRRCQYHVTATNQAIIALRMLRENRDMFDLVISDVHMPDMDGFKLLELVGLEMDLPVIMLSVNGETKTVMKGITHGACDYLLKPVRIEELKNIWQHVVRRKFSTRDSLNADMYEECNKPPSSDSDYLYDQVKCGSSVQSGRPNKKRKEYHSEEEDEDGDSSGQDNDDPSAPKRPRVVWSVELHRKFVTAVNHLGIDKAVPKRILELMNVEKLTRENVASHLQKYRVYLRRLSAVASQQAGIVAALGGRDPFLRMDAFEGLQGYQAFTSPAALSTFGAHGLLNSPRNNQTAVVIQGVATSRSIPTGSSSCTTNPLIGDAANYHLSPPGNRHGNLAQGLVTSLGQTQLEQKWMNEGSGDLSSILSGSSRANGMPRMLPSVTSSPLLPSDLVECTQAQVAIQPPVTAPSASLEQLEGAIGASSGTLVSRVSQQNALSPSGFSANGLLVHGSLNNYGASFSSNGATRLGDAFSASFRQTNDFTVPRGMKVGSSSFGGAIHLSPDTTEQKYLSFGSSDSLLDPKLVWSSSQLPSNIGAHHFMSQRSNNCSIGSSHGARMFGQTSAGASTAVPQAKFDILFSGDASMARNASESSARRSESSAQRLQSELSSSTCSFDGLLNSMIKVEKDDVAFSDDLGCDFYSFGACI
ncbi:two-component response regulator ORR23-like isoform X1 [Hordeum vulgare subsp. vulgare]|uniref:Two-component response regulator n=2 Tax=Hordeum vulgare subsp. vulgare TaxID=112509 RepID=A0A8I6Y8F0_HORVV|nr:two-component response regulator ORR23-like isoform X1 [Hordeum vulgare subsp. vulgare]